MAYLGNPAANRFAATESSTKFSGNGSAVDFTLEHSVGSPEDILVSVDGVVQEPTIAYGIVTGTTLRFTSAPSSNSGNNIFVCYLFRTIGTVTHPATSALNATNVTAAGTLTVAGATTLTTKLATTNLATGAVVQVKNVMNFNLVNGTTVLPKDDTIPQKTEGTEMLTLAITPTNANNKLLIVVHGFWGTTTADWLTVALFQDTTANALAASANYEQGANATNAKGVTHFMTAGTTSETTFKVRVGNKSSATSSMNGINSGRLFGGIMGSGITITEIAV